ncbi:trans-aconitate 2-methyltransferase [Phytohabitans aurantiacus]|jgi:trans-aconitate 2-methyltransferase|uniref:Trans-aconitate 2-methyltransferase n=1 Tax=Phytohabitans aurantiacus TaxID=3016789 RepID=A0ABQ5RAG9_9ACTN|nr:trans-aconitate 2-methyltransferase [Phytohabitans aurantiacus]GLI03754.1 putative trans-aconitate 2-methyltransferase [Phytohabitans aurantiacus]
MWDPSTYLRFGDERSRPFFDLVARIPTERPRAVVDLGCGPGNLTAALAERWPGARIRGFDSSTEMIEKARTEQYPIEFSVGDVREWSPRPDDDVAVSNAVLQWVPGHDDLLRRWSGALAPGACLAVQVPGNFAAPSHRALRAVASEARWQAPLAYLSRDMPVLDSSGYADILHADCVVDAWETTYLHQLPVAPGGDHPVLTWMEGTALRPVRAALGDDDWAVFRDTLGARLAKEYPASGNVVFFPFHRIFFVAVKKG